MEEPRSHQWLCTIAIPLLSKTQRPCCRSKSIISLLPVTVTWIKGHYKGHYRTLMHDFQEVAHSQAHSFLAILMIPHINHSDCCCSCPYQEVIDCRHQQHKALAANMTTIGTPSTMRNIFICGLTVWEHFWVRTLLYHPISHLWLCKAWRHAPHSGIYGTMPNWLGQVSP